MAGDSDLFGKRPARTAPPGWLSGRAGRREYWLYVTITIVLSIAISRFISASGSGLATVLVLAQIRRLHDFGRTGWWALAANVAPAALMLLLMALVPLELAFLVATLLALALTGWIGWVEGDPGDNRFGPSPRRH